MKSLMIFFALLPLAAADKPAAKPAVKSAPKAVEIPAGAVETQPGNFTFTDPQGKKWIYRKTPFGVARLEDKGETGSAAPAAAPAPEAKVTAEERGDSVHFERAGPFGVYKWDRKKTDLNAEEKAWVERERARREPSTPSRQD